MMRSALLADVPHGFTTRAAGDFRPPAGRAAPALVAALGGRGELRTVTQVHGARVVVVPETGPDVEADAIVCTEPGVVVAVRVADCVPVLLAAPGAVAAVHAGWRGTAAGVVRAALDALCATAGVGPEAVCAAVGPAIGGCCYVVGDEVIDGVAAAVPGRAWLAGRHVDLARANADLLAERGVRVERVGTCTRCDATWWSHRRDGAGAGRQVGAIRL